jgi:predicted DNA-binding transcriptional regulator YafY
MDIRLLCFFIPFKNTKKEMGNACYLRGMPANKYALLRYRIIDRCLTNKQKPYPSRDELRDACEEALYGSGSSAISLSTIDKDLWAMKNEGELGYYAPIAFSREHKGYFYSDPNYTINEVSLAEDDLEAIRFAAAILDQFRHVPILANYENAIEKIIHRVNISPRPDDSTLNQFIQFEKSTVSKGNDYLGPLLDAIRSRLEVELHYRSFRDDVVKKYTAQPLLLKEYSNRWYLIAHVPERNGQLTFGLERIEEVNITKKKFAAHTDFNASDFFRYSIGITESKEKPQKIVLRFAPIAGKLLATQPIHSSQRIVETTADGIRMELEVIPSQELIALLLSYGGEVEIEQPATLRKKVAAAHEKALTMNR